VFNHPHSLAEESHNIRHFLHHPMVDFRNSQKSKPRHSPDTSRPASQRSSRPASRQSQASRPASRRERSRSPSPANLKSYISTRHVSDVINPNRPSVKGCLDDWDKIKLVNRARGLKRVELGAIPTRKREVVKRKRILHRMIDSDRQSSMNQNQSWQLQLQSIRLMKTLETLSTWNVHVRQGQSGLHLIPQSRVM
jgi:hypothetical protein